MLTVPIFDREIGLFNIVITKKTKVTIHIINSIDIIISANYGFKTMIREKFARVKLMLYFVFNKQSKILVKKVEIK